ncbi:MAG TPA: hypothetical protein VH681_01160 [Nitrospiraceae bacterium]
MARLLEMWKHEVVRGGLDHLYRRVATRDLRALPIPRIVESRFCC